MAQPPGTTRVIARVIDLLGGPERAREVTDTEFREMVARWNQDTDAIGRILWAHLYVEHYLTEFLGYANPRLESIADARLSFKQKLALLNTSSPAVAELKPGIAQLNRIRNRLAHRLNSLIEPADSHVFLAAPMFSSMRLVSLGRPATTLTPIELLEQFSLHAANILAGEFDSFSKAFEQALQDERELGDVYQETPPN